MLSRRRRPCQPENAIPDGQGRIGWDDEDAVLFDRKPILGGHNWNGTVCTEQLHQQALVVRIEVLHQYERHAGIGWRTPPKPLESGEAARPGADAGKEGRGSLWQFGQDTKPSA